MNGIKNRVDALEESITPKKENVLKNLAGALMEARARGRDDYPKERPELSPEERGRLMRERLGKTRRG
jgi:hypothetical protein